MFRISLSLFYQLHLRIQSYPKTTYFFKFEIESHYYKVLTLLSSLPVV